MRLTKRRSSSSVGGTTVGATPTPTSPTKSRPPSAAPTPRNGPSRQSSTSDLSSVPLSRDPSSQSISSDTGGVLQFVPGRRRSTKQRGEERAYPPSSFGGWGLSRLRSFRGKSRDRETTDISSDDEGLSARTAPIPPAPTVAPPPPTTVVSIPLQAEKRPVNRALTTVRRGPQPPSTKTHVRSSSADSTLISRTLGVPDIAPLTPRQFVPLAAESTESAIQSQSQPVADPPVSTSSVPSWSLNRNASGSTASSALGPSTDESAFVETPHGALLITGNRDTFGHPFDFPTPSLSRASTLSYQEGDDRAVLRAKRSDMSLRMTSISPPRTHRTSLERETPRTQTIPIPGLESPTQSTGLSAAANTPSGSSSSTVRERGLRISTSHLGHHSHASGSPASPYATERSRRHRLSDDGWTRSRQSSVAFDVMENIDTRVDEEAEASPTAAVTARRHARPNRPSFGRQRSSSLGNASVVTSSVYSIGEVRTATRSVFTSAQAVALSDLSREQEFLSEQPTAAEGLIESMMSSSDAVRRAFEADAREQPHVASPLAAGTRSRSRSNTLERGFGSEDTTPRRQSVTTGPAPPPPHLVPTPGAHASLPPLPPLPPLPSLPARGGPSPDALAGGTGSIPFPQRPQMPARQSSLSRLWRKFSTGPSRTDRAPQSASASAKSPTSPLSARIPGASSSAKSPRTSSRRALSMSKAQIDSSIPEVPPPPLPLPPGMSGALVRSSTPKPSRTSTPLASQEDKADKALPPPPIVTDLAASTARRPSNRNYPPNDGPLSAPPVPNPPSRSFSYVKSKARTVVSDPYLLGVPDAITFHAPLGPFTPPIQALVEDYFTSPPSTSSSPTPRDGNSRRSSTYTEGDVQSHEVRRRYRQTLVEIEDDAVFQSVLEDLSRLEGDGRAGRTIGGGIKLVGQGGKRGSAERTTLSDEVEAAAAMRRGERPRKASREGMQAWFVTRELVQGERRYGRLLTRGVSMVKTATNDRPEVIVPLPTLPPILPTSPLIPLGAAPAPPTRIASKLQRARTAGKSSGHSRSRSEHASLPPSPTVSSSRLSLPPNLSGQPVYNSNGNPHGNPNSTPSAPSAPTHTRSTAPFALMREHLPRLLAVSLTVSSRFEHDPSPYGVADAFLGMQRELVEEMSVWASEMGGFMSMGLGAMVGSGTGTGLLMPMAVPADGIGKRSKSTSEMGTLLDQEERLGLGDIIIMPIQRALRYKLLFRELASKITPNSNTHAKVLEALRAAEVLAAECDRRQTFPLEGIRRSVPTSASSSTPALPSALETGTGTGARSKSRLRPASIMVPSSTGLGLGSEFGSGAGQGYNPSSSSPSLLRPTSGLSLGPLSSEKRKARKRPVTMVPTMAPTWFGE